MTTINQKEYLKKYLGIGRAPGEKKKKRKKEKITGNKLKIIDDDAEVLISQEIQDDISAANEDAPQIVAVIDERPPSLRIDEQTKNNLWAPIGETSVNTDYQSLKLSHSFKLNKQTKSTSGIPINLNNSNRLKLDIYSVNNYSKVKVENEFDSSVRNRTEDHSPPRKRERNDDHSPPRRRNKADDILPTPIRGNRHGRKNDYFSLPYEKEYREDERRDNFSALSKRGNIIDDNSPPRRKIIHDSSPPVKRNKDDDISPPRKKYGNAMFSPRVTIREEKSSKKKEDKEENPSRSKSRTTDKSPPRKKDKVEHNSPSRNISHDEDVSPPRMRIRTGGSGISPKKNRQADSKQKKSRWGNWSTEAYPEKTGRSDEKMTKTLDGKKAGLQNAKDLVTETIVLRHREDEIFKNMSAEVSGVNAATIVRGKKVRDLEEEARQKDTEKKTKEKYDRWGKGLKQVVDQNERIAEQLHEMSKPLARYADDDDLEKYLKEKEREGDPMLAYIRKKKKKESVAAGTLEKPVYMGEFMPNRFGIHPGYRWDGVDRSNGYEKKWFQVQNSKKATQEEAFKWSTEDM